MITSFIRCFPLSTVIPLIPSNCLGSVPSGSNLNSVQIYDIAGNSWSAGANLPTSATVEAIVIKGYIYAFDSQGISAWEYDIVNDQWNTLNNFIGPFTRPDTAYLFMDDDLNAYFANGDGSGTGMYKIRNTFEYKMSDI